MIVKLTSEAQRTLVGCDLIDGLFIDDTWDAAEKIRDHYNATGGKELLVMDRDFLVREMDSIAEAYDPDMRCNGGGNRRLYRAAVTLLDKVRALKPEAA